MNTDTSKELAEVRWQKLRILLRSNGILRVEALVSELGVSAATVRRDLAALEKRGELRRVHGGAIIQDTHPDEEPLFDDKTAIAADEKQRIAEAACAMIGPKDVVYLDGGSTVLALARLLVTLPKITVVTNSLRVAQVLSSGGPKMILTGGESRLLSQTLVGPLTRAVLEQVRLDLAFMGTIGVSAAFGLTTTDPAEAFTKEFVMGRAARAVLLADSTKFGKTSFVRFGEIRHLSALVTDTKTPATEIKAFKRTGVNVITV